jgi:hypothetical protein
MRPVTVLEHGSALNRFDKSGLHFHHVRSPEFARAEGIDEAASRASPRG